MKDNKLRIITCQNLPFVIESKGKYSGFEVELWEEIAKEIGASFDYEKHNFQELIPLIADKKADVAIGAITINEKREEIIDFSHPIFHSGLRILLSKNRSKIDFFSTIRAFLKQGYKQLTKPFLIFLLIIFIFGNILWLGEKSGGSLASTYFPGVFQAVWLSLCTVVGSTGSMFVYGISTWYGRLILTLVRIMSLAGLGLLIGELTAFITTRKIRLNIEGPNDLRGKLVATVRGTTSESILKELDAVIVSVTEIGEAYNKLKRNEVEAVVFDAPVLEYYVLNDKTKTSEIVGELFDEQDYGIAFQEKFLLREEINRAILTIKENGFYDTLYKKYFGKKQ